MSRAIVTARFALWAGLALEGAWFFIAFGLAPSPYPYQLWLLLAFWLLVFGSAFSKVPAFTFVAACINFLGCALTKSLPGGISHPWLWFIYDHSVDFAITLAALVVWILQRRRDSALLLRAPSLGRPNFGDTRRAGSDAESPMKAKRGDVK